jgi:P-type Cu+ transporter
MNTFPPVQHRNTVPKVSAQPRCAHCNDVCHDTSLRLDAEHCFCCTGCKTVYEILQTNNLCSFYEMDEQAGQSLKQQRSAQSYAYLDDPELQQKLLEFNNGKLAQVTLYLPQMHCVSCIWLLEQLSKLDSGVNHAQVNFLKKTITVQYNSQGTSLRRVAALLTSLGYAPEINLGDAENGQPKAISRRLAGQIAVAGFAFGNIMLFSFPEYVGMDAETYRWFANVFGYLSLILSLPVLLFSVRDYFLSAWQGLKHRILNIDIPLCLALGSLFGRSVWEILTHSGAGYLDSFAGLTFLLLVGKWFQQRTWNRLSFERDYKSYFPIAAALKKPDGEEQYVPVARLVPGDIITVRSQEIVPADGILLKGEASVDYSFVTGESDPVRVQAGEAIFAGGRQLGPAIEVSLTRRVAQSQLTRLWNNTTFARTSGSEGVSALADQAGRFFSWLILTVGSGAMLYWWLWQGDPRMAINAFTAVMIVACPCTIALSIPYTLGNIVRLLGRQQFYLKNNAVLEALARFDAVVFDKTGTITQVAQQQFVFHGQALSQRQASLLRSLSNQSSHPLSRRLCSALSGVPVLPVTDFEEITGAGIKGRIEGVRITLGSADFIGVEAAVQGGLYMAIEGQYLGFFDVKDSVREGLADVLAFFSKNKKSVYLLSGDQDREAAMLRQWFPNPDTMFFQQSPQQKLEFIRALQQKGQKVLMIGDGLNDAGALKQSDMGIVVSENTNNFTPACHAIVHASAFGELPRFVAAAKAGVSTIRQSYVIALFYNLIGLSYAVSGHLSPLVAAILMPASSISIVLFGILMGNWRLTK